MNLEGRQLEKVHEKSGNKSIPFNCAIAQCFFFLVS